MSSFYVKNVPTWERVLRIVVAAAVVVLALTQLDGVMRPLLAAGAVGFALTGLVGYCPACAMIGRRLDRAA
jgi:hypothetical protein